MKKNSVIWQFIPFFVLTSFVTTCSFLLFFHNAEIPEKVIRERAGITFANVLLISALFTMIDMVRRILTVERPVSRILDATRRIKNGDYTVQIKPFHTLEIMRGFNQIITDFNQMARELSSTETLRTDFIASVSHELKTPLAVIRNYASLLQTENLPAEKKDEYMRAIIENTERFSELITNILRLNKLENQQIFPQNTTYDLGEQLCECLLCFENIWEQRGIEIETDIAENIQITTDNELFAIVWNNLFSNALKFSETGGKIVVSMFADNSYATVSVSDTGCGISNEVGKHIFDKFYQGDTSHHTQGNGLGLALVKRIIDITGSDISVSSEIGVGSTFTVTLRRNFNE